MNLIEFDWIWLNLIEFDCIYIIYPYYDHSRLFKQQPQASSHSRNLWLINVLQACLQRNPKQRPSIEEPEKGLLQHPFLQPQGERARRMQKQQVIDNEITREVLRQIQKHADDVRWKRDGMIGMFSKVWVNEKHFCYYLFYWRWFGCTIWLIGRNWLFNEREISQWMCWKHWRMQRRNWKVCNIGRSIVLMKLWKWKKVFVMN